MTVGYVKYMKYAIDNAEPFFYLSMNHGYCMHTQKNYFLSCENENVHCMYIVWNFRMVKETLKTY